MSERLVIRKATEEDYDRIEAIQNFRKIPYSERVLGLNYLECYVGERGGELSYAIFVKRLLGSTVNEETFSFNLLESGSNNLFSSDCERETLEKVLKKLPENTKGDVSSVFFDVSQNDPDEKKFYESLGARGCLSYNVGKGNMVKMVLEY